jgi:hypothetical protein
VHEVSGSTAASAVVLGASPRTVSEHQSRRAGAHGDTSEAHVVPETKGYSSPTLLPAPRSTLPAPILLELNG